MSAELTESLRSFGQRCEASLHATLLTAWMVLLSRYGQDLCDKVIDGGALHLIRVCCLFGLVFALGFLAGLVSGFPLWPWFLLAFGLCVLAFGLLFSLIMLLLALCIHIEIHWVLGLGLLAFGMLAYGLWAFRSAS